MKKSALGCAAALATLNYIEDFKLIDKANQLGNYMRIRLKKMQEHYEIIGDVRGIGLLYGVELVLNRNSKEKSYI
ncbi:aminotransferase class III-fold pyridoxal phosphate-dependent enzyme [Lysinibacillus sp. MHQ-1]|nr:aminotransferase class III-fold pyridoxal phosphate-dependent enzyme [Lysinibacillus sp. MHQ-1]